jgi:hypothetical protein
VVRSADRPALSLNLGSGFAICSRWANRSNVVSSGGRRRPQTNLPTLDGSVGSQPWDDELRPRARRTPDVGREHGRQAIVVPTAGEGFRKISDELAEDYLLGYSSTNTNLDGRFHKIDVVAGAEVSVSARRGYQPACGGNRQLRQRGRRAGIAERWRGRPSA